MSENEIDDALTPGQYWTTAQAAEYLGMTDDAVKWHIKHGNIPALRIGIRLRIHPDDVKAFVKHVEPVK